MPDLDFEKSVGMEEGRIICGIDEAGRGPLAGPVIAAAAIIPNDRLKTYIFLKIRDSKKIPPLEREEIAIILRDSIPFSIGMASVEEIDRFNILQASFMAMRRAFAGLSMRPDVALIDGNRDPKIENVRTQLIVKGDSKSISIAAASIIAKVHRDQIMQELAQKHQGYGWETNMGYGTAQHLAAIERLGPSPEHRRSFRPIYQYSLIDN